MRRTGCIKYSLRRYDRLDGNFTQISNDVFKLTNGNEFKIYCYLCSNYNKELGYTSVSLNVIAKNTNISVPTIIKSIKGLEELGLIKMNKFEYKSNNIYEIFTPTMNQNKRSNNKKKEIKEFSDSVIEEMEGKIYTFNFKEKASLSYKRKIDYAYKKWRKEVLERDKYTCRLCGKMEDEAILNVHHIERYSENEELRTDINNGITLCYDCHKKIFGKEKEFEDYFKKLICKK